MGLIAQIYHPDGGDCSNGGLSSKTSKVCIVNIEGPFEPSVDAPAVLLVPGFGSGFARIIPANMGAIHTMFGGCFVATSDSRFSNAVELLTGLPFYGAVALHDRVE